MLLSSMPVPGAPDLQLKFAPDWLGAEQARHWLTRLSAETPWAQPEVKVFGRSYPVPRLTAWYGDPGAVYGYSGLKHQPLPWSELLGEIRQRVEAAAGQPFNGVLLNLYRDGQDANGWHSDNEAVLGRNPVVASLSLGGERRFDLRRRDGSGGRISLPLPGGSLLVMGGATQHYWLHQIARTKKHCEPRLNLSFRLLRV